MSLRTLNLSVIVEHLKRNLWTFFSLHVKKINSGRQKYSKQKIECWILCQVYSPNPYSFCVKFIRRKKLEKFNARRGELGGMLHTDVICYLVMTSAIANTIADTFVNTTVEVVSMFDVSYVTDLWLDRGRDNTTQTATSPQIQRLVGSNKIKMSFIFFFLFFFVSKFG